MKTHTLTHHLLTGLCFVALMASAWAAQTTISAQIQPQSISLGDSAQLAVTIKGSQVAEPDVPSVSGLNITPVGQSSSMRSINGTVTTSVTHIYHVTADRAGSFTIPAITAPGAGSTAPITLRVDQGAGGQTRRAPAQLPAPGIQDDTPVDAKNQSAFLRVILPKHELTVGELVPVEVKACFRAGVSASLNGLPMLSSDAFTLNKLSDHPEQTREIINGTPYTVVTWTSSLSAVKAGEYPLNLDLPVMVRVKQQAKRGAGNGRNPFKDFFGANSPFDDSFFADSFFDDFFGTATEKPLTLHTDGAVVKIKALPLQGRPANFSGAVGQFAMSSEATTTKGATGDPLTLKVSITGQGNFGRVSTDGLPASANWKSYKPSAKFEPGDISGTTGTKTFEQSIVPLKAGHQQIPTVSFSYFDPEKNAYVAKATQPIAIDIAANAAAASPSPNPVANAPTKGEADTTFESMAPDQEVPAHVSSSLRPLVLRPWFIVMNAMTAAGIILGALLLAVRSRRASDPRRRLEREAAEKAVKDSLAAMDEALTEKDDTRFFDAARRALQERLASQWQVPVTKVTLPEIRARLNGHAEGVSTILQTADDVTYAGKRFTAPDLTHWRDLVKTQLEHLSLMKNSPSSSCSRLRKHLTHEEQKLLDDMQRSRRALQKKAPGAKKTGRSGRSSLLLFGCVVTLFGATTAPLRAADRPVSAPALYNEGNAAQRAGRLGPAILSYERARLLAQDDTAIIHNLDLARQKAGVASPVLLWWQKPAHWLSFNGFAVLGSLSLLLFAVAFFGMPVLPQSLGRIARGAAVSLGVVTLLAWSAVAARWPELDRAVVIGTQPTVHIAPAANAAVLFDLKPGELVSEGGSYGGFVRIRATDGRSGWVSATDVEKIIPPA